MPQENEVVQLHLDDIIPNRFQPREIFDEKAFHEHNKKRIEALLEGKDEV